MKKLLKKVFVGSGEKIRKIRFGIAKGIIMQIDADSKSQRILGLDEKEIQAPFKTYSRQSDYFFDIGSSDGYYSLIYKKLNPAGKIYAFEVKEDLTQEMQSNFSRNNFNYGDVTLIKKFVTDKNDEKHVTLDSVFEQKGQTLFFKIDVDGGEMDVLNGLKTVLTNNICLFVIETHTPELEKDCIAFLQNAGYNTTIIDNASWRSIIPENRPIAHNRWFTAQKK
jgi:precorrin-6B methylase 2